MNLDADMARVLDRQRALVRQVELPDTGDMIDQLRQQHEESVRWMTPPSARDRVADMSDDRVVDDNGDPIAVRIYRPAEPATGTLLWFHGGGWVTGSLDTADVLARALCARADVVVVSVDYRLAPEHPWPAAIEDARRAVLWASEQIRSGLLPGPVMIGGDSAGGNISAVAALEPDLRPLLHAQLLVYPAVHVGAVPQDGSSLTQFGRGFGLDLEALDFAVRTYVPCVGDRSNPRVSPTFSPSLRDAPQAVVLTAGHDVLRDEGNEYATALRAAGVPTKLIELPGLIHGCLDMIGQSQAAAEGADSLADALRHAAQTHGSSTETAALGTERS